MSEAWSRCLLGDVAEVVGGGTPSTTNPSYWGGSISWVTPGEVTRNEGQVVTDTERTITLEGLAASSATLLPKHAVLMTSRATVGAVAIAGSPLATNQGFAALVAREGVLPYFLMYWVQANRAEFQGRASGSTFPEINRSKVKAVPIRLPVLSVQRRIVDLIGALDAQIAALVAEARAVAGMEVPLIEALVLGGVEGVETLPLGEVGEFIRGRRFTKEEYVPTGLGCMHYGQVHTHFRPVAKQTLTFLPEESRSRLRLARPGDVVIAATSEDVDGLGKATVWLGDDDIAVHDDCYIFRHRLDPKFASYVFVSSWFQHQKRRFASGSKVTRISGRDLARIEIPIPPITVQARIGEALDEASVLVDAIWAEITSVRRFRASLLKSLLSQRLEIPESYDALMNGVVQSPQVAS